jgi:SagB-type dehydrogenase family enzyme
VVEMPMRLPRALTLIALALLGGAASGADVSPTPAPPEATMTLDEALRARRSVRDFAPEPLARADLDQVLFAAQGITGAQDRQRTVPSAGALHPLEVYVVVGSVEGLAPGVYHYVHAQGILEPGIRGDLRQALCGVALGQECVCEAPASLVITAVYERTTRKYGRRGERYVHIEVGHVAQNVYLQAAALRLGTVSVGAFEDQAVKGLLGASEDPLLIMPLGHPSTP